MKTLSSLLCHTVSFVSMATIIACGDAHVSASAEDGSAVAQGLLEAPVASGFVIHTRQQPKVGAPVKVRVDAIDANGVLDDHYVGIASVVSSDATAVVPVALAFSTFSQGEVTFMATFSQAGTQQLKVADASGRQAMRSLDVQPADNGCAQTLPAGAECRADTVGCCATGLQCTNMICVPTADPKQPLAD